MTVDSPPHRFPEPTPLMRRGHRFLQIVSVPTQRSLTGDFFVQLRSSKVPTAACFGPTRVLKRAYSAISAVLKNNGHLIRLRRPLFSASSEWVGPRNITPEQKHVPACPIRNKRPQRCVCRRELHAPKVTVHDVFSHLESSDTTQPHLSLRINAKEKAPPVRGSPRIRAPLPLVRPKNRR